MAEPLTSQEQHQRRQAVRDLVLTTPFIGGLGSSSSVTSPTTSRFGSRYKGMRASTVAMSIQYTGAAKRCDLLCHARTARRRKELTFTEITATDADGNVVGHAVQTYRIV